MSKRGEIAPFVTVLAVRANKHRPKPRNGCYHSDMTSALWTVEIMMSLESTWDLGKV